MKETKCSNCQTWNTTSTCSNCNTLLDAAELHKKKVIQKEIKAERTPKPKLDQFFINWKKTKNPFYKGLYYIAYSFWAVYMGILSFILMMVAWGPG